MAKYECSKFEDSAGCFQQLQTYIDTQIEEVKLRVKSVEYRVEVIENHVEYALIEIADRVEWTVSCYNSFSNYCFKIYG
jgi:hypothetical protein